MNACSSINIVIRQGTARPWRSRQGFGRFLPELAGGVCRPAGPFRGGPVDPFLRFIVAPLGFIAEPKGAHKCLEIIAEHRTEIFAEVAPCRPL